MQSPSVRHLTIVIIVLEGKENLARCLSAFTGQTPSVGAEIIVPYDDVHRDVAVLEKEFSGVRFLAVPGRRTPAELRALAVQDASREIVAIIEDHCIPESNWITQVLIEHDKSYAAIGGAVEKAVPDTIVNWSLYLADYIRYAKPMPAGMALHLTDCNVTYKRDALGRIAEVWADEFHEPEVNVALRRLGETLWFSPTITVHQQRSLGLFEAIRDRYAFGRLFGARRALGSSMGQRLFYTIMSPFLPFLLTARVGGHVVRRRRYLGAFLRALPFVVCLNAVWAWGEFVGNMTVRASNLLEPVAS